MELAPRGQVKCFLFRRSIVARCRRKSSEESVKCAADVISRGTPSARIQRRIAAMSSAGNSGAGGFLSEKKTEPEGRSWLPWIIAGVVVVVVLGGIVFSSHRERAAQRAENASQTADLYASQLTIGSLQMSE